jgi:hypothetical protein
MFELKQHQALDRKEVLKLSLEVINLKRLNFLIKHTQENPIITFNKL